MGVFKKKYHPCLSDIFTNCKRKNEIPIYADLDEWHLPV